MRFYETIPAALEAAGWVLDGPITEIYRFPPGQKDPPRWLTDAQSPIRRNTKKDGAYSRRRRLSRLQRPPSVTYSADSSSTTLHRAARPSPLPRPFRRRTRSVVTTL